MKAMRKPFQAVAVVGILFAISNNGWAGLIGGLDVSNGPTFGVSETYQNVPTSVGATLSGYGKVDSINSIPISSLCSGCELTYTFGGYTVTSVSPTEFRYSGGSFQYYLGFGADKDFTTLNAGGSAGDLAEATNGTLFLSLTGHAVDAAGNTLILTGTNIGTVVPTGFSSGLLDVNTGAGGIANAFFNANSVTALFGGPSDFEFGSSFTGLQPAYPGECPGGPACLRGSADLTGTATGVPATAAPGPDSSVLVPLGFDCGGLNVSNGATFGVSQIYQNVQTSVGNTLSGYGKVDSINSIPIGSLCPDCELTYRFGGYTVTSVSPTEIRYSGGSYQYYLAFGANKDFTTLNAGGSAGDLAEATNGTLFLSLKGHAVDAAGNTLIGIGTNIGTVSPTGFSSGLVDVDTSAGGIANGCFDANTVPALFGGNADFEFGSSFTSLQPTYPGECPFGPACLRGSGDFIATALAITAAVPEPTTIVLLGLGGLAGLAASRRRKKN